MLNIFSGGVNTAINAEDYTVAVQIAESLLAKAGTEIEIKDHQSTGIENEKYRWTLYIRPFTISGENFDPKNAPAELYKVNAVVEWGDEDDGGDRRQLQLATLKLATKNNGGTQN